MSYTVADLRLAIYNELNAFHKEMPNGKKANRGGFGFVDLLKYADGRETAIKFPRIENARGKLAPKDQRDQRVSMIQRELYLIERLNDIDSDRNSHEIDLGVKIYHSGKVRLNGDKFPFFERDYIHGDTLDKAIKDAGDGLFLDVFRQLSGYLSTLHGYGLVDRDIKPGNIIVGPNGKIGLPDRGTVWVGDDHDINMKERKMQFYSPTYSLIPLKDAVSFRETVQAYIATEGTEWREVSVKKSKQLLRNFVQRNVPVLGTMQDLVSEDISEVAAYCIALDALVQERLDTNDRLYESDHYWDKPNQDVVAAAITMDRARKIANLSPELDDFFGDIVNVCNRFYPQMNMQEIHNAIDHRIHTTNKSHFTQAIPVDDAILEFGKSTLREEITPEIERRILGKPPAPTIEERVAPDVSPTRAPRRKFLSYLTKPLLPLALVASLTALVHEFEDEPLPTTTPKQTSNLLCYDRKGRFSGETCQTGYTCFEFEKTKRRIFSRRRSSVWSHCKDKGNFREQKLCWDAMRRKNNIEVRKGKHFKIKRKNAYFPIKKKINCK